LNSANQDLYIIARQPGAENPAIPTCASRAPNPATLADAAPIAVGRREVEGVPGAFQLLNVLSADECARMVALTETLGYLEDAAVSLPRTIRHNLSATWVADDTTCELLWQRCRVQIDRSENFGGKRAVGLNARFRFYRYDKGDYFGAHTDGSWPGSRVIDGKLFDNAWNDRWSQLSFLLFLSEDFTGGATRFYVDPDNSANCVDVRTPLGGVLCFPHGEHPLHCVHASEPISGGVKYIIRSDVLFEL
jgi:predicted 2-oxoglutarate/Fe(II)-dependent dioxygenase YbiX